MAEVNLLCGAQAVPTTATDLCTAWKALKTIAFSTIAMMILTAIATPGTSDETNDDGEKNSDDDNDCNSNIDDSASSTEEMMIQTVTAVSYYLRSYYAKQSRTDSVLQGAVYYRELVESDNERRFYDMARMRKETFFSLLRLLESTGKLSTTNTVTSGEKLLVFVRILCGATNRTCGERWQIAGGTVCAALREVNAALRVVRSSLITSPSTDTPRHIAESRKFYPYFENCIGAIDVVSASKSKAFRNRKGFISQNVLAACDFEMKFCYLLAGWEASAHDGRVYGEAHKSGFPLASGKYYLADAGYSLTKDILTPYRGVRYHLKEWAEGNQKPQTKEELYNLRHSSLRNVIERIFGVLKQKFPILRSMLPYSFATQVDLVLGAAAIYNFIRQCDEILGPLDTIDSDLH